VFQADYGMQGPAYDLEIGGRRTPGPAAYATPKTAERGSPRAFVAGGAGANQPHLAAAVPPDVNKPRTAT